MAILRDIINIRVCREETWLYFYRQHFSHTHGRCEKESLGLGGGGSLRVLITIGGE